MARSLYGTQVANVTHEGAAKYDVDNPLLDLVFTKGSVTFQQGFYQSQQDELQAFIKALKKAEEFESGFGWKYGAYVRDPKNGKGNRIQGSVVPAVLAATYPEEIDLIKEYVVKSLSHRPDDVIAFVAHFENLGFNPISEISIAVRDALAVALESFSDYQLLKYSKTQVGRKETRFSNKQESVAKTIRLVDVMGMCYNQLSPRLQGVYRVLHTPTRNRNAVKQLWPAFTTQREAFKSKDTNAFEVAPSLPQVLSVFGNTRASWDVMFEKGMVPDLAFLINVRNMAKAGFSADEIIGKMQDRKFEGIWPHQAYAGYKALSQGVSKKRFEAEAYPKHLPVFEAILKSMVEDHIPNMRGLGFGDVSGSMGVSLNEKSTLTLLDVSKVLCAAVAVTSGYAATFSDHGYIANIEGYKGPFDLVLNHPQMNKGWGSTQVYGAVMDTIKYVKDHDIEPFKILYFFSDMQFHPPGQGGDGSFMNHKLPPLELALKEWQDAFGEAPLVALWNLSSYEGAPLKCDYPGVAFVSGYDANVMKHLKDWASAGGRTVSVSKVTNKAEAMSELLDFIRSY